MSAQNRYGYKIPIGAAGGIVDIAPYAIDTFLNAEETGKMKFGMGVVQGDNPGKNIAIPATGDTAAKFDGITVNNRTTEYDVEGNLKLRKGASVGVMRYGRVYARVAAGIEPTYGETAYLVISGDDAGCFTNASSETAIAVKGRFLGGVETTGEQIAIVELFNEANV